MSGVTASERSLLFKRWGTRILRWAGCIAGEIPTRHDHVILPSCGAPNIAFQIHYFDITTSAQDGMDAARKAR